MDVDAQPIRRQGEYWCTLINLMVVRGRTGNGLGILNPGHREPWTLDGVIWALLEGCRASLEMLSKLVMLSEHVLGMTIKSMTCFYFWAHHRRRNCGKLEIINYYKNNFLFLPLSPAGWTVWWAIVWVRVLQRTQMLLFSKHKSEHKLLRQNPLEALYGIPTKAEYIRLCKTWPQPAATAGSPSLLCATPSSTPYRSLEALDLVRTPLRRGVHCCPCTATLFYLLFEERNLWVVTSLKSTLLAIPNCLYFTACTKSFHTSVPLFMLFLPLGMPILLSLGLTLLFLQTECLCLYIEFIYWSHNSQDNGIRRWGLWEVIKFSWGHEGRVGPPWWD